MSDPKIQIGTELDATGVEVGVDKAKKSLAGLGKAAADAGKEAGTGLASAGKGGEEAARAVDQATTKIERAIERQIAQANSAGKSLRAYYEDLAKLRGADTDRLKPLLDQLDAASVKTKDLGVTAAQTAFALRGIPAQMTDIVVGLQSGQSPLTVLLQQGGQLKDMFGGAGAAAKAMGGYLLSLINPYTAVAAAVAAIAAGYALGAREAQAFNKALVLSGNAAGATVSQLAQIAAAVAQIGGTQSRAAEVITTLVEGGRVGAESLGRLASAAIALERVGGQSAEETAKQFTELGRSPLQAAIKLNEATNFLTASTYEQIKALGDQGRMVDAAKAAQEAYAASILERTPQVRSHLGLIERAWLAIKDAAKGAGNIMMNVGRSDVPTQIASLESQIGAAQRMQAGGGGLLSMFGASQEKSLREQLDALQEQERLARRSAAAQAEAAAQTRARVEWDKAGAEYLSKEAKMANELRAAIVAATEAHVPQAELLERIAAIREKYADKTTQSGDNELANLRAKLKAEDEYLQRLAAQGAAARDLNEGEKAALRIQEQMQRKISATARATKEKELAVAVELGQRQRLVEALKADIKLGDQQADQIAQQADAIAKKAAEQEAANAVYGKGKAAVEALTLAELKKQAADLEATDRTDPRYLANLYAKIAAQERLTKAVGAADFKQLNQGAQEWLRSATEAARLQAEEPAMLALTRTERERLVALRAVDLEEAKKLAEVENSQLTAAERAVVVANLRAAAEQDRSRINTRASQSALREITDFLDPIRAESFGAALGKGFDTAASSLVKLSNSLRDYDRQQRDIAKQQQNLSNIANPAEKAAATLRLNERAQQNQIALYANMAGAAKGFFAEGSKGYKMLEAAETSFRLVQLASDLEKGLSAAAVGIANQAQGDPYTAFPRMAVMAAAMAALGFAVSGAFNKSSTAPATNKGTGTVFGDASAASESLKRSLDLLADVDTATMRYSAQMADSLRNIEASLAGVTDLVLRNGSVATGANFKVQTGTLAAYKGDPILNGLGLSFINDAVLKLPVLGGVLDKLQGLWGKTTQDIAAAGIYIDGRLADLMSGRGLSQFADIKTTSSSWFGLVKSTGYSTQFGALDDTIKRQFAQVFAGLADAVKASAGPLGVSLDTIEQVLSSFVVDIGRIDLKGLTGDQIQERLSAVLGAAGDRLAHEAIAGLDDFQRVGEGYLETVVRVASGVEQAGQALQQLGVQALDFTAILNRQSDVAAEIVRQSIVQAETAGQAVSGVGRIIDHLSGTATDIASAYTSLLGVRSALEAIGVDGGAVSASMLSGAGGLQKLLDAAKSFEEGYLTEAQRIDIAIGRMTEQFARLGLALPASGDAFVALVQGIDTTTEAGQKLLGQVLSLADGFSVLADHQRAVVNERAGLQQQLDQLEGNTAALRERELAALDPSNRALQERIYAIQDEQAAAAAAQRAAQDAEQAAQQLAAKQQAIASERATLEGQILQLEGNTAELRARELAKLDESNRALQERIYALQDEQAAASAAAQAAQELAVQQQAVASERYNLETQILQLEGNTAELRRRELEKLDPSNRALQERVYALQDEQAAAQAAQQAAQQAAAEAQRLQEAWQSVGDSIAEEIKRIRGVTGGGETLAQLQARFAVTSAQARAGDQEAAKSLPAISQALLQVAEAAARTSQELEGWKGRTAASLEQTLRALSAYGVVPKFAAGGSFAGGLRIVGEHGPELEATGAARIYSTGQTAVLLGGGIAGEIRDLRAEVVALRSDVRDGQAEIAAATGKTARLLHRVMPDGDALATRAAA